MPNLKAPGKDKVQGFWIKSMTNLHERIAEQLNGILIGESDLPGWMTYGHTILCQKDVSKGNAVENYRPITCLPLMWKLLTGVRKCMFIWKRRIWYRISRKAVSTRAEGRKISY